MATVELTIDADEREDARSDASADADFALAHVSDLHLSTLDGVSAPARSSTSGSSATFRGATGVAASIAPRCSMRSAPISRAVRLDHIAVTGDLTHIGLPHEFRQAAAWLERLGAPERITVVPGNHDAYVREAWRDTFAQWSAYMRGDDASDARKATPCFRRCVSGATWR